LEPTAGGHLLFEQEDGCPEVAESPVSSPRGGTGFTARAPHSRPRRRRSTSTAESAPGSGLRGSYPRVPLPGRAERRQGRRRPRGKNHDHLAGTFRRGAQLRLDRYLSARVRDSRGRARAIAGMDHPAPDRREEDKQDGPATRLRGYGVSLSLAWRRESAQDRQTAGSGTSLRRSAMRPPYRPRFAVVPQRPWPTPGSAALSAPQPTRREGVGALGAELADPRRQRRHNTRPPDPDFTGNHDQPILVIASASNSIQEPGGLSCHPLQPATCRLTLRTGRRDACRVDSNHDWRHPAPLYLGASRCILPR
jgi:hypothetical protein